MNYEYTVREINVSLISQGMSASHKPDNVSGEVKRYRVVMHWDDARPYTITMGGDDPKPLEFSQKEIAEDFCTMLNMARKERLQGVPKDTAPESLGFSMTANT